MSKNEQLAITGQSLSKRVAKEPSPEPEDLISDDRIREILAQFSPILHNGIEEADKFFMRSAGQKLANAVPMRDEEIDLWQKHHQVIEKTLDAAQRGKLFVPEIEVRDKESLGTSFENETERSSLKQLSLRGDRNRKFRVNLDEVIKTPVEPFEAKEIQFLVKPHAHLGGGGGIAAGGRPTLYNAFVGLHTYAQDKFGRWVVDVIAGTTPGVDGPSWGEGPVYSPYMPARSSVWFNTSVEENKPNKLEVRGEGQFDMTFHCEIHHPEKIDELKIPDDDRLRFFFWQLEPFIINSSLEGAGMLPQLESGEK